MGNEREDMSVTTINCNRFEVQTMTPGKWYDHYQRTDIKLHDSDGFFGAPKYDYFMYLSRQDLEEDGYSVAYILLHTRKSLEKMNQETKRNVREVMHWLNIEIDEVEKNDLVIVAIDEATTCGSNSMSTIFTRRDKT